MFLSIQTQGQGDSEEQLQNKLYVCIIYYSSILLKTNNCNSSLVMYAEENKHRIE